MRFSEFSTRLVEAKDSISDATILANFIQHRYHDLSQVGTMPTAAFINMLQNWDIPITFKILQQMYQEEKSPIKNLISNLTADTITFGSVGDEADTTASAEAGAEPAAGAAEVGPEIKVAQMANRALTNRT